MRSEECEKFKLNPLNEEVQWMWVGRRIGFMYGPQYDNSLGTRGGEGG